jgi:signal transduction histidine kinase
MKHSIILKFLAVLMAAVSAVAAIGCAAGIVALESANLYINGLDALQDQAYESISREIASTYAELYAAEALGDVPYTLKESMYVDPRDRIDAEHWYVRLSLDGKTLSESGKKQLPAAFTKEYSIDPLYFITSLDDPSETEPENTETTDDNLSDTTPDSDNPDVVPPEQPDNYLYSTTRTEWQNGDFVTYYLSYYQAPEYTVTVQLQQEVLENSSLYLLTTLYPHRYTFLTVLALSLLLAAVCLVYLLNAAGHCADGSIRPGGLNRIPLDLYGGIVIAILVVLIWIFRTLSKWVDAQGPHTGNLSLMGVNVMAMAVVVIAFLFATAAQIKVSNAYWWHHSILGWSCGKIAALFRLLGRGLAAVGRKLPLMWHWPVAAGCMAVSLVVTFTLFVSFTAVPALKVLFTLLFVLNIGVCVFMILYSGWCYATLMKGVRQMSSGDLSQKIPTRYLRGSFLDFALQLNALSDAAMIAAEKQMQSERMKSELITNVSHDIKTPLTSIINFVDLLQKPHSDTQRQDYLEVLSRQSGRMKKLIDDLMELSKASSGSITVDLQRLDAAEAVNQALGELSDKLDDAGLTPVFRSPQQPLMITADGRLVWRVLNNLLTNAIKYAMPGTRLYLDLLQADDQVLLSVKNVSKEPLNINATELLERFVRGDTSRKSEGSGLGLNIAKNLMEVQGGQLQLLLDGDLFKVTLIFPVAVSE